ncbi:MAG: PQQ-dependent sugar dehydrogenase [Patescibacteria group bacterium]|mgnify:CR=1 FL=1
MRRKWLIAASIAAAAAAALLWPFVRGQYRALRPALAPPPADIGREIETSSSPLHLPPGFHIEIFSKDIPDARVLAFDPDGNLWVSQIGLGKLTRLEIRAGKVVGSKIFTGFKHPHGLAFDPKNPRMLYLAEENRISRTSIDGDPEWQKVADLPGGGRHFSRTIGFGPDGRLYVAIGSTCDVCLERDARNASIQVVEDGKLKEFARGLRNAVFFAFHPATGKMWATEMGRDNIGDEQPPDEIDVIEAGKNYGWPNCYGRNIHDAAFDKNVYIRNPCLEPFEIPSLIDIPAHSAPLGLAFAPASWPEEYRHDFFVAYHGSWNRSVPAGYKVVRMMLDAGGKPLGSEDFIGGWLTADGQALGRPVDIAFGPDGAMYISDDKAGVVYRVIPPAK